MVKQPALSGFLLALVAASCINAEAQTLNYRSANGLRARVVPVGSGRESRIEIRLPSGKLIRWKSFASADGQHGKIVGHAVWSAKGEFFVFSTTNTGGHQPWSWATYFYSQRRQRFYLLDHFIGPITSDFSLSEANVLKTTRLCFENDKPNEAPITVRLNRLRL